MEGRRREWREWWEEVGLDGGKEVVVGRSEGGKWR